jgi:hypothetical protein
MSDTELLAKPKPGRRLEVFTGAGRRERRRSPHHNLPQKDWSQGQTCRPATAECAPIATVHNNHPDDKLSN